MSDSWASVRVRLKNSPRHRATFIQSFGSPARVYELDLTGDKTVTLLFPDVPRQTVLDLLTGIFEDTGVEFIAEVTGSRRDLPLICASDGETLVIQPAVDLSTVLIQFSLDSEELDEDALENARVMSETLRKATHKIYGTFNLKILRSLTNAEDSFG